MTDSQYHVEMTVKGHRFSATGNHFASNGAFRAWLELLVRMGLIDREDRDAVLKAGGPHFS